MNLLAEVKKLKSFIKPGLIALIPVFLGCDSQEDPGTEFDLGTNVDVKLIEFDLTSTNTLLDSTRTDGENRIIVGSYDDPLTGNITAEGYFQFSFAGGTLPIADASTVSSTPVDTLDYDSLYINLEPSDFTPFLQSGRLAFEVVELRDTLLANVIYLSSKSEVVERVLGTFDQEVNIINDTIFRVKLDNSFGFEFYNLVSEITADSTRNLFATPMKDWGLRPLGTSESLSTIDLTSDNTQIKLYMSGNADSVYVANFEMSGSNYTNLTRNRAGSPIAGINEGQDLDIAEGTILDPIAGITTAFNIDGIMDFFADNPNILINNAIVDFGQQDFVRRDTLDNFRLYFRKDDGGIFGPAIGLTPQIRHFEHILMADAGYTSGSSSPALVVFNSGTEKYSVSPTLFFQAIYNNYWRIFDETGSEELSYIEPANGDTVDITNMVMISPTEVTTQQAVFNNSGIKLRVYYTEVN